MASDLEQAIITLLEEEHKIPRAKLLPSARLAHDLGVDGDDAAELFQMLHEGFGTDFSALDEQWTAFFSHEGGISAGTVLTGLALLILSALLGTLIEDSLNLPDAVGIAISFGTFFGLWFAIVKFWPGAQARPVTIAGLAEIVEWGAWPDDPEKVR